MGIDLEAQISQELTLYSNEIITQVKAETSKSMAKLVSKTKSTAPVGKRKKHFKSHIKSRTFDENNQRFIKQWYVDGGDYRLTHLLENGHATRNGGRVEGKHFIKDACDEVITEYERNVEEIIKNA